MGGCVGRVLLGLRQWSWYGICNGEHGSCPLPPPPNYSDARSPKQTSNEPQRKPSPLNIHACSASRLRYQLPASRLHSPPQRHTLCRQRPTSIPTGVSLDHERSEPWALPPKRSNPNELLLPSPPPPNPGIKPPELQLGNATLIRHYLPESLAYTENTIGFFVSLNLRAGRTLVLFFES